MHALICYYCLFCPISVLSHTLIQLCTLYYIEMKIIEELSKHVFKKLNALYKTIKANLHVKCSSPPQTKQTISLVSMFLLNLL